MRDANAIVERPDPHCIAWIQATASLWGMSSDHDLDEPVRLTGTAPVRLRAEMDHDVTHIVADRELTFLAERAGTHLAVRFEFRDGTFFETELIGMARTFGGERIFVNWRLAV